MEPGHCKVCGETARYLCTTYNGHGRVKEIHNFRCEACGLVFVGNHLSSAELGEAYATIDSGAYFDEVRHENRRKFEVAAKAIDELLGAKNRNILDVGAGNGEFLESLLSKGYTALAAHEIPGSDLSRLREKGVVIYQDFEYAAVPSSMFDLVTLLDVAEHVPDPHKLFEACFRVLRPGGYVYFHTPAVTKVDRMMHYVQRIPVAGKAGRIWQRGRTSIFHLQNYTDEALDILLRRAGFLAPNIVLRNELSWPVQSYVRVYLCELQNLPRVLAPLLTPVFYPLLATTFFNANKAVVRAQKP